MLILTSVIFVTSTKVTRDCRAGACAGHAGFTDVTLSGFHWKKQGQGI